MPAELNILWELELDPMINKAISIPQYDNIDDEIISLDKSFQFSDGKLTGDSTFLIKLTEVDTDQYLTLKEHLRTMEYNDRKMAIFSRLSDEDKADVIFNTIEREYDLTDANNWTETVTIKEEIKTYNGKKDNSEIKFNYNEGWEAIELLSAKVTTGDKVKEISEDEKNLMDAGWVASAPRYPASKTLVASLPGVEIGSMIEYKYKRTMKDQPFFTMGTSFAWEEPVKHQSITVKMPESINHKLLVDQNGIMIDDVENLDNFDVNTTTENGIITYTFSADDLKVLPQENNTAPTYSFALQLRYQLETGLSMQRLSNATARSCIKTAESYC